MPAYITNPQVSQVVAVYPGNNFPLVNDASVDGSITKTIQVAIGPDPMGNYRLTLHNTTGQTATVQTSWTDVDADYEPYSDESTAITVATATSKSFPCFGPWLRCTFSSAPTTGSLVLSR